MMGAVCCLDKLCFWQSLHCLNFFDIMLININARRQRRWRKAVEHIADNKTSCVYEEWTWLICGFREGKKRWRSRMIAIRQAVYEDIPRIMQFIDEHWKKGYILARERAFLSGNLWMVIRLMCFWALTICQMESAVRCFRLRWSQLPIQPIFVFGGDGYTGNGTFVAWWGSECYGCIWPWEAFRGVIKVKKLLHIITILW